MKKQYIKKLIIIILFLLITPVVNAKEKSVYEYKKTEPMIIYEKYINQAVIQKSLANNQQNQQQTQVTCDPNTGLLGNANDEESVAWLLQKLLDYARVIGPFIVIIMSGIDFAKVVITSDDESMKKAQSKLITRIILAAALFFVVDLVKIILDIFGITANPLCGLR